METQKEREKWEKVISQGLTVVPPVQMADIKDACQKAGWEKVKAMQNAEKQGKDQSDMGTDVVHVLFLVLKNPVQAEESQ